MAGFLTVRNAGFLQTSPSVSHAATSHGTPPSPGCREAASAMRLLVSKAMSFFSRSAWNEPITTRSTSPGPPHR
eukprot:6890563-Prymnesium_polylepis.1